MIAWIDASVGCAGDMLLAGLVDAGANPGRIREGLAALGLPGWELRFEEVHRGAFRALHAQVLVHGHEADPEHAHDHDHDHDHHHDHDHGHDHVHRPWRDIRTLLEGAALPERARRRALDAYRRLAEAEAYLHGMAVDDVELHEVGALDAIIDIVGVCLALEDLDIDDIVATPLPMGEGHVHAAHGRIPLPAPATLELVRGWPIVPAGRPGEWVTPTGAALVTTLARPGGPPAMIPARIGHGAGRRDPKDVANLLRVMVGRSAEAPRDEAVELACNLDDLTGELVGSLVASLMDAGALDAWAAPVVMKKGRPGVTLHALVRPADADRLAEKVLRESSTLGVRRRSWSRDLLERWTDTVETAHGTVRVKVGGRDGEAWHAAPEHDDVLAVATAAGAPPHEVHRLAMAAWTYRTTA